MALRNIAQLKAWFKVGLYPSESQFHDWLDSFFHKEEKIPISSVDQLSEQLNRKYPDSDGKELEKKHNILAEYTKTHEDESNVKFTTIYDNIEALEAENVLIKENVGIISGILKEETLLEHTKEAFVTLGEKYKDVYTLATTVKDLLEAQSSIQDELYAYGIEWDIDIPTPMCQRIGNRDLHRILPIQNAMKGCLLNDNGDVIEYLAPNNWSAHVLDGSNGQVMVEIPAHYRKFVTSGTKRQAWISSYPLSGYHFVHKSYVSAYEAVLERSTGKLCSIVNMGIDYRGGSNLADRDGTDRSLLGRPVTYLDRKAFRDAARLRGAGSQWNCYVYEQHKTITWLFFIEYATLNSQMPLNAAKDVNGYAQGGLGNGATTLINYQLDYYGRSSFLPCGLTNEIGNNSGEVGYVLPKNSSSSPLYIAYANRYRGVENPFGHIGKWLDGINIDVKDEIDNETSKVYISDNPAEYRDGNSYGYIMRGYAARDTGYIKEIIFGEFGDIIPSAVGGSSTTYFCDHNLTRRLSWLHGVIVGGNASSHSDGGFCSSRSFDTPNVRSSSAGSRLSFIPVQQ